MTLRRAPRPRVPLEPAKEDGVVGNRLCDLPRLRPATLTRYRAPARRSAARGALRRGGIKVMRLLGGLPTPAGKDCDQRRETEMLVPATGDGRCEVSEGSLHCTGIGTAGGALGCRRGPGWRSCLPPPVVRRAVSSCRVGPVLLVSPSPSPRVAVAVAVAALLLLSSLPRLPGRPSGLSARVVVLPSSFSPPAAAAALPGRTSPGAWRRTFHCRCAPGVLRARTGGG